MTQVVLNHGCVQSDAAGMVLCYFNKSCRHFPPTWILCLLGIAVTRDLQTSRKKMMTPLMKLGKTRREKDCDLSARSQIRRLPLLPNPRETRSRVTRKYSERPVAGRERRGTQRVPERDSPPITTYCECYVRFDGF
ncbi:hypothetical protein FKM82_017445 [Ascaphus truei]